MFRMKAVRSAAAAAAFLVAAGCAADAVGTDLQLYAA